MGLAFVPVYIHYLGMESYALIGVFTSLQAWLVLLDMGLTPTLNREMARFMGGEHDTQEICDLLQTLGLIYAVIAVVIAASVILIAPWLANNWLQVEQISVKTVSQSVALMGIVVALRWVAGLYRGAIMGLQRQVWLNGCNIVFATLRGAGVVIVLKWYSPTISAFFIYQGIISAIEVLMLKIKIKGMLPAPPQKARFNSVILKKIWNFAAGMMLINLLAILLTQIDKLLLSKMLTLTEFGYYVLAGTLANALYLFVTPVCNAALPRMTELVSLGDKQALIDIYHNMSQLLAVLVIPVALVISFFSEELLLIWVRDAKIAAAVAPLLSILVIGSMLNGLMNMPYMLQLANGWTRLTVGINTVSIVILLPSIYFGAQYYGAIAAAMIWVVLNTGYILIGVPLMHRVLLPAEKTRWYKHSVCCPLAVVLTTVFLMRYFIPEVFLEYPFETFITLVCVFLSGLFVSTVSTPFGRSYIRGLRTRFIL